MPQQIIDVNSARPGILEQFIGQRSVVDRVKIALEASWNDGTRLPHMLFCGPSGCGKTQLAEVISKEMGGLGVIEQLGQNLNHPIGLSQFLLRGDDRGVLFVDEAHLLCDTAQTLLYRALEERTLHLPSITSDDNAHSIPLADFTMIMATTDQFSLLGPLLNRFRIIGHFNKYSSEELEQLLDQRCRMLRWEVEAEVLSHIARLGRGVPRHTLRLLEATRRTSRAEASDVITLDHFGRTCALERLDHAGLDELEQRYLQLLSESRTGARLNVLAARLALPTTTVQANVEAALLEEGYIEKRSDGQRALTQKGWDHLSSQPA